ncbi:MAG: M20/M25/M40 family metallo-hydrolase, partial [Anaerolineales bacterium]
LPYFDFHPLPTTDGDFYSHHDPNPDVHSLAYLYTHLVPDLHSHVDPNTDADSVLYFHSYANFHSYPNFHIYSHINPMSEILPFLKELLSLPGLSGHEAPVAEHIERTWRDLADEVKRTPLGSVHAVRFGNAPSPRPRALLAAHMDAIGLMVTQIVDGFLRVTGIGGIDARILPGQPVTVYGREPLPGVVVMPTPRLLPPDLSDGVVPMDHLWVDVGLPADEVNQKVQVGDLVAFGSLPTELSGETIAGHSLDNRASVAALTVCLQALRGRTLQWDAVFAATVQEEETMAGALTSAFVEKPALAIAIDVTFAKGPGANDWQTFPLGKGITLAWGPNIHPALHRRLKEVAERAEIPYSVEYTPRHSGTDAYAMQIVAEGIPTAVVSIPLRYMHTPVEVVSLKDIQRAGRLLAEFLCALDASFTEQLTWA